MQDKQIIVWLKRRCWASYMHLTNSDHILVGTTVIVHTDHSAIKYLFDKNYAKSRLIWWIFLLQELDLQIIGRKGTENQIFDHL